MKEVDEAKLMFVSILTLFVISVGTMLIHFLKDYTVMNLLSLVGAVYISILITEKFEK